jgi:hypothetical protein
MKVGSIFTMWLKQTGKKAETLVQLASAWQGLRRGEPRSGY